MSCRIRQCYHIRTNSRVLLRRGAFSMGSAFQTCRKKAMADYGADGVRGGLPSWESHMRTPAGKAELRAFAERVQARYEAEVSAQPAHLLRGAPRPVGFWPTPICIVTVLARFPVNTATESCQRGFGEEAVGM